MISIEEDPVLSPVDFRQLAAICTAVGWRPGRTPERLQHVYATSLSVMVARDESGSLVGLVRTIGDPFFRIFICDLVIQPEFQGQGYGTRLLQKMTNRFNSVHRVSLLAAPGKEDFYRNLGWKEGLVCFDWQRALSAPN